MMSVSGVFRNVLTHRVPKPRRTGTGETRIAASTTPSTSAPTVPAAVSFRIQRNPVTYTSMLLGSEKTSIALTSSRRGREQPGGASSAGPARPSEDQLQLVSLATSSSGAAVPLLPSELSHAALYEPSAAAAFRMSLILLQPAVSSFLTPMP